LALTLGAHQMTTLALVVLDLERGAGTVVSAGHLPPIVHPAGGAAELLEIQSDAPLGVSPGMRFHEHEFAFPTGSGLVLVTDGAVEVRGESIEHGLVRLRALVAAGDDLEDLCERIAAGAARGQAADDDVAVLAVRHDELPERLHTSWPASRETLA